MGRYTGAKARINRRLHSLIYENGGASRALERRDQPPGMAQQRRRPSNYGLALMEKQKIKHYYGLGEKHLRRYFGKAGRMKGNTGEQLLLLCERRLDNVVRRAGLATTRPQARQGVVHGHFLVNGTKVTKPSFQTRPGDVIQVREKTKLKDFYKGLATEAQGETLDWVTLDGEALSASVQGVPGPEDISLPVDVNMVVEFLSR